MSEKKEEQLTLFLENSANGVKMILGDASRVLDAKTASSVVAHLEQWLEWYQHWIHQARYYKDYSLENIDKELDQNEKNWEDWDDSSREYSIGDDFASYLGLSTEMGFCDNGKASKIVETDWKKEFPQWEKELTFDAESSFCYVYTKNREVARTFSWWAYNKYIKHHLEDFEV
jgi:hypothetical protein